MKVYLIIVFFGLIIPKGALSQQAQQGILI
jgi:hypothetical protein